MKPQVEEFHKEFDRMGLGDCLEAYLAKHPESPKYLTPAEFREQVVFSHDAVPKTC